MVMGVSIGSELNYLRIYIENKEKRQTLIRPPIVKSNNQPLTVIPEKDKEEYEIEYSSHFLPAILNFLFNPFLDNTY
jgi:hypothetical protein